MSELLALSVGNYSFSRRWGWGIHPWQRLPTSSPDVQHSFLHPHAALRTWYLGQQPGRKALLERCYLVFATKSKSNKLFL